MLLTTEPSLPTLKSDLCALYMGILDTGLAQEILNQVVSGGRRGALLLGRVPGGGL